MRVRFSAITPEQQTDRAEPLLHEPKSFVEMVIFSVVVSVASQIVMHYIFGPRR